MLIDDVQRKATGDELELSARIAPDDEEPFRAWFSMPREYAPEGVPDATPFLPSALHWSMQRGERITVDGPVSPQVIERLDEIQGVMSSLFPGKLRLVEVHAQPGAPPAGADMNACFFSGGVDSWHAGLALNDGGPEAQPPLTHLVFSRGLVSKFRSEEQLLHKLHTVRLAADTLGLGLVVVDTNLKHGSRKGYKGPILISSALALGCRRVVIPSGVMQAVLRAKMTHPTLDFRFSTEATTIVHYGSTGRHRKMVRLAQSEAAMRLLDVCKNDTHGAGANCGACEKCLRTMIGLHVLGALDACPAFERPLEPGRLFALDEIGEPHSWVELLHELGDTDFDRSLAAGIQVILMQDHAARMNDLARGLDFRAPAVSSSRRSARAVARSMKALESAGSEVERLRTHLLDASQRRVGY